MAKFNKGWNESDSLDDSLGKPQGWFGADYRGRKLAPFDGSNGRGAVGFGTNESFGPLGKPTCIATASAADVGDGASAIIKPVESRGNVGFSEAGWADIFGKPQSPGKA